MNALCEKRLQSSMFKWPSFYYFLEFHYKILNSYAAYRCKKMVKILNCYLNAKKSYGTLSKVAIFFGHPCVCSKEQSKVWFGINVSFGFLSCLLTNNNFKSVSSSGRVYLQFCLIQYFRQVIFPYYLDFELSRF